MAWSKTMLCSNNMPPPPEINKPLFIFGILYCTPSHFMCYLCLSFGDIVEYAGQVSTSASNNPLFKYWYHIPVMMYIPIVMGI